MTIDRDKLEEEARFDGKWVLGTNMNLPAEKVALKYKELWQVKQVFRDMKSVLNTRPIFHKRDETIRGHVFCSFLALALAQGTGPAARIRRASARMGGDQTRSHGTAKGHRGRRGAQACRPHRLYRVLQQNLSGSASPYRQR